MNGGHDLGGLHGLGAIGAEPEASEPIFHHEWERRAFALTMACGFLGEWNIDESRHARERQHPVDYLRNSYYENWLAGLVTLLIEKGLVTPEEIEAERVLALTTRGARAVAAAQVPELLRRGGPVDMPATVAPRFAAGEAVRVANNHPLGHTRAPRYTRGRTGTVAGCHGCHVFPDANALGASKGERRGKHLYSVRFEAPELWGNVGDRHHAVYLDMWEPYLESAR